jgi:hypothetical protein
MAILFAAMEDDTVLCEACLHDLHDDVVAQTPATMLHAFIDNPVGLSCRCCAIQPDSDT